MLKLVACEDEPVHLNNIQILVHDIFTKIPILYTLECFSSGEELFQNLQNGSTYDIALLDICMKKMSGIELAEKIRKYFLNEDTILIYITSYDIRAKEVFQYNTHRFLSKPIEFSLFEEALLSAHQKWKNQQSENFCFRDTRLGSVKVLIKDILYMESARSHCVDVITRDYIYSIYNVTLAHIHNNLSSFDFILIHHSTLVNFDHIKKICYESIEMSNDMTLMISGPKRREVRKQLFDLRKRQDKNIWL